MSSIIDDLRASLKRSDEIETDLPDGSSVTVTGDEVPNDVEDLVFDNETLLALESDINIDEKVLESLIANGEILSDIDLALECFKYSGLPMDDLTYASLQKTYNKVAGNFKLPSLESALGLAEGDRTLVRLATEAAVTDRVGEVLKKIIDTILKLFQKIKDWYVRIFDQAAFEQRRAKKLLKLADSVSGAPTDNNVTLTSVREIGIGNKAVPPERYLTLLIEINRITDKLMTDVAPEYNRLTNELTTLTRAQVQEVLEQNSKRNDESLSSSQNDVEVPKAFVQNDDKMLAQFIERFSRMIEKLDLKNVPKSDDPRFSAPSTIYHLSPILPGNKQMSSAHPDKSDSVIKDLGKIKNSFGIGVVEVNDAAKQKGTLEIAFDTLSITDIKRIAQECVKLCGEIIEYKTNYSESEKRTDQFLKTLQNLSRSNEDIDATSRQAIGSIVGGATSIHKNMMNGEGRWVKYVMDIVIYSLDWCKDSLAQYDHGKMNQN